MCPARVQEIERHLVVLERGELRGELSALLHVLAHSEDAPAADLHPGGAHSVQRLPALLPGVGGDHGREVRARRLEVVVVAVRAHRGQGGDLLGRQHAQRAGDRDVDRLPDGPDPGLDLRHEACIRSPDGGDDAELGGAGGRGLDGGLHQRRHVQPGGAHGRGEQPRLGAEVAVLGAAPSLEADDALDLDLGSAVPQAHLVRQLQQVAEPIRRQ